MEKQFNESKQSEEQAKLWKSGAKDDKARASSIGTKVAIGAAAGAAVAGGLALYNRQKAKAAKTLLTESGHTKAVQEAKDYISKMEKAFGNVSINDLKKKAK